MAPLNGVRILAIEQYYSGNIGSLYLRRLGAEVIKLEPNGGDVLRHVGPSVIVNERRRNVSELRTMGGKLSLCLDLQHPLGKEAFWKLVANVDVVWTNMKPSSLKKLGITFEALKKRKQDIVYTTISGFGHDDLIKEGPFGQWTAFDLIAQGLAGLQFRAEGKDDEPGYNGIALGDIVTALMAAMGTIAAIYRRDKADEPQRVDVAMHDAMVALNELPLGLLAFTGKAPPRGRSGTSAPYGSYPSSDGFINVTIGGDPIWKRFCVAMQRPELATDPRFEKAPDRVRNYLELDSIVSEWTAQRTMMETMRILERHNVPAAPVFNLQQVMESPQVADRNMLVTVDDPVSGPRRVVGNPIKMTGVDDSFELPPHEYGADTTTVLRDIGGISEEEIIQLVEAGAVEVRSA